MLNSWQTPIPCGDALFFIISDNSIYSSSRRTSWRSPEIVGGGTTETVPAVVASSS
jgi:hypothetical protein